MAAMGALWAASHLAVVGEIADIALLITGGILMGRAAIDVGGDLAEFMTGATGATTHQDLDDAAQHFAAAFSRAVHCWSARSPCRRARATCSAG
jgi:hypothetical protein